MFYKENLIFLLKKYNYSQSELARRMNISRQSFSLIMKGENPQATTLIKLSEIFQVSIDDLLLKDLSKEEN